MVPKAIRRLIYTKEMRLGLVLTFLFTSVLLFAKVSFVPEYTSAMMRLLVKYFNIPDNQVDIGVSHVWNYDFSYLVIPLERPSTQLLLFVLFFSGLAMLILPKVLKSLPTVILLNLLLSASFFFTLLFLLIPNQFLHTPESLSLLFATIALMVFISGPLVFWIIVAPVPADFIHKFLYLCLYELTANVLYFLKYAFFIVLCTYGTFLVMPYVILILLSLWDIIYMNAIFSYMVSRTSKLLKLQDAAL